MINQILSIWSVNEPIFQWILHTPNHYYIMGWVSTMSLTYFDNCGYYDGVVGKLLYKHMVKYTIVQITYLFQGSSNEINKLCKNTVYVLNID